MRALRGLLIAALVAALLLGCALRPPVDDRPPPRADPAKLVAAAYLRFEAAQFALHNAVTGDPAAVAAAARDWGATYTPQLAGFAYAFLSGHESFSGEIVGAAVLSRPLLLEEWADADYSYTRMAFCYDISGIAVVRDGVAERKPDARPSTLVLTAAAAGAELRLHEMVPGAATGHDRC